MRVALELLLKDLKSVFVAPGMYEFVQVTAESRRIPETTIEEIHKVMDEKKFCYLKKPKKVKGGICAISPEEFKESKDEFFSQWNDVSC